MYTLTSKTGGEGLKLRGKIVQKFHKVRTKKKSLLLFWTSLAVPVSATVAGGKMLCLRPKALSGKTWLIYGDLVRNFLGETVMAYSDFLFCGGCVFFT